jgi:tetratricopeptide (TPR) repeat protein
VARTAAPAADLRRLGLFNEAKTSRQSRSRGTGTWRPDDENGPLAAAEKAAELVQTDPRGAAALARTVLQEPRSSEEARSVAERALGMADRDLGRLRSAIEHLEAAVAHGQAAGSPALEANARSTLAMLCTQAGDPRRALRQANLAAALPGGDTARLRNNRALMLQRLGRDDEALLDFAQGLVLAHRHDDRWSEARVLSNRGLLHVYRGEFAAAERDLRRAHALHLEAGATFTAAEVTHNIGFLLARRGDVPAALAHYDEADRVFHELGLHRAEGLVDRCDVLMSVRLLPEARDAAAAAVAEFEVSGQSADAAEARLMLARACLLGGDTATAAMEVGRALKLFEAQRRRSWSVLASFVQLQVAAESGKHPLEVLREAKVSARRLDDAGWPVAALDCQLLAARAALALGDVRRARLVLSSAARARTRGPAALRLRAWHAEALLRLAQGQRTGALAAVRAGMRVADEHSATLGATELRVRAGSAATELAEVGMGLALERGRPSEVLIWAERWRARRLEQPTSRPPVDAELGRLLGLLRETVSRIDAAALDGAATEDLLRYQAVIESAARRRSLVAGGTKSVRGRLVRGSGPPSAALAAGRSVATLAEIREALGDRALVELIAHQGGLFAVVVTARRSSLVSLGPSSDIGRERVALLFALGRLARRRGGLASLSAAKDSLDHAARTIDELILAPLARDIEGRELVLVPNGELHALAWSLLPSLARRPVSVVPSASLWVARAAGDRADASARSAFTPNASARNADDAGVVLVAGPGVPGAVDEVVSILRACYPGATTMTGAGATAAAVSHSLEGASLAHIAAHGVFRADNALFSSLQLADGPLTVYDLEGLRAAPDRIVLSACDAGLSSIERGGEAMGPTAALLGLGTRTLVASVAPVPDRGAGAFMLEFHRRLAKGEPAAQSLAITQADLLSQGMSVDALEAGDPQVLAAVAAAGFVCFGVG